MCISKRELRDGNLNGHYAIDFVHRSYLTGFIEDQVIPFAERVESAMRFAGDRLFSPEADDVITRSELIVESGRAKRSG